MPLLSLILRACGWFCKHPFLDTQRHISCGVLRSKPPCQHILIRGNLCLKG